MDIAIGQKLFHLLILCLITTSYLIEFSPIIYPFRHSREHGTAQRDLIDILQRRYAKREDVGVFGDLIIKWGIEGLGDHCPDVCVVFGLRQKEADRSEFIVPEEGTKPVVVMEVVSPRYRKADRETKMKQYAQAGVAEYLILDRRRQRGEIIDEVLGYYLEEGSYVPIAPDEEGRIFSQALDVWIGMVEGKVMLFEGRTGELLLTSQALAQLAEQECQRAEQEYQRAERLAERLRQLGLAPDVSYLRRHRECTWVALEDVIAELFFNQRQLLGSKFANHYR